MALPLIGLFKLLARHLFVVRGYRCDANLAAGVALHLETFQCRCRKKTEQTNDNNNNKKEKREVVCSFCTQSDTRPKYMRTFLKEMIRPRIHLGTIPSYNKSGEQRKCSLDSWGELWWPLVLSGIRFLRAKEYKWADNWNKQNMELMTKSESFFFSPWGHNFGFSARRREWIAWSERDFDVTIIPSFICLQSQELKAPGVQSVERQKQDMFSE